MLSFRAKRTRLTPSTRFLLSLFLSLSFFFFNDTATTEIYTLSLHDALPICRPGGQPAEVRWVYFGNQIRAADGAVPGPRRSEEHTSELQSQSNLVCRLLLEKKKTHTGQ